MLLALAAAGLGWELLPRVAADPAYRWALLGSLALAAALAFLLVARAIVRSYTSVAQGALRRASARNGKRSGTAEQQRAEDASRRKEDASETFGAAADAGELRIRKLEESLLSRTAELAAANQELNNRDELRLRESRMALRMQRRIVPRPEELPARAEINFGALYEPCDNTGGDLYDAVRAGKNGYTLLAADVSGRGVTAALIAALVKSFFRARASWGVEITEVLESVNEELSGVLGDSEHFVTAFFASLDLESGALSFASAGHPPALLVRRRTGIVEELGTAGPALGVLLAAKFTRGDTRLEEGDRIILYTDGVTGTRNLRGESYGRERLVETLRECSAVGVGEIPATILSRLDEFCGGLPRADDAVILACELRSFARPEPRGRPNISEDRDWRVLARRGADLASAGKLEDALSVYERLLELEPEDATALNNLGALLWRMGKKEEAAERFRAAALITPDDPRIKRNLEMALAPPRRKSPGS
ncbi:MAG TPA: SpoIIE family protein phosphatase [Rectinemataceae bacterium]|nr:SpoIIE family protein phosphatase [Rectinemataceae bacterium]